MFSIVYTGLIIQNATTDCSYPQRLQYLSTTNDYQSLKSRKNRRENLLKSSAPTPLKLSKIM